MYICTEVNWLILYVIEMSVADPFAGDSRLLSQILSRPSACYDVRVCVQKRHACVYTYIYTRRYTSIHMYASICMYIHSYVVCMHIRNCTYMYMSR